MGNEDRLSRLLSLVPYVQAHPGVSMAELAEEFGVTALQIDRDLKLLWLCGLPGHGPGDLIDLAFEGDSVSVTFDAGMSRPLRLSADEALATVVSLRTLAEIPAVADADAVRRALAKIEAVTGDTVAGDTVTVALEPQARIRPALQLALDTRRALHLRYYSAGRNQTSERTVDPLRLFTAENREYLEAWCREADGLRVFRVDRILAADVLDEPSTPPEDVELRDLDEGLYQPSADHLLVTLRLSPPYAWMTDYYRCEQVTDHGDELEAELRVADPGWLRALVLGSSGGVQVMSPLWLAEGIAGEARQALAAYEPA